MGGSGTGPWEALGVDLVVEASGGPELKGDASSLA